jgi:FlaA1/EpsC-like NDP-sugar epimerase
MIAPRTRGRIYLQSFMDAVITFSTFWAYLFVFILLQPGESRAQLEMLGAALVYSLTALAAVTLQGFYTIYSRPNWWRAPWAMSHKLSLNQVLWAGLALCVALAAIGDINTSRLFLLSWLALLYFCLLLANRYLPRKIVETISDGRTERTMLLGTFEAHPNLIHWRNHREASGSEVFEYIPDFSIQQLANLERLVEERNVTEIVLTETPHDPTYLRSLIELGDRLGTRCILLSEHAELFRHKVTSS